MFVRRALSLLAVFVPACMQAQAIRGAVVDRVDSLPVAGVVVQLLSSTGEVAARALTNERGEFRLLAPGAGKYRLRTMRIGFRPAISDPIELADGAELVRKVAVASVAFSLDTVRVVSRSTCKLNTDSALVTYAIWEQVRTALTAAALSAGDQNVAASMVTYEKIMEPHSKRVRDQTMTLHTGVTSKIWTSLSADSLHRVGYVAYMPGYTVYSAPDIDALLSRQFLEDHCFRVADVSSTARIGVSFEPIKERKRLPEIRGTVWLDRKTSELNRMEFRYANVRTTLDATAGGEMEFVRMKNGQWAISRWHIRMPVVVSPAATDYGTPYTMAGSYPRVAALKVGGGDLAVVTRGADTLWARPRMVFAGMITEAASGRLMPAARITLSELGREAVADAAGRFKIFGVLPGRYTIQVRTPALDSLGTSWETPVEFADESQAFDAAVPSTDAMVAQLCPPAQGSATGLVVGRIKLPPDSPVDKELNVTAEWIEGAYDGDGVVIVKRTPHAVQARTAADGTFRICGVPINAQFHVRTALSDGIAARGRIVPGSRFARVDVVMDGSEPHR